MTEQLIPITQFAARYARSDGSKYPCRVVGIQSGKDGHQMVIMVTDHGTTWVETVDEVFPSPPTNPH